MTLNEKKHLELVAPYVTDLESPVFCLRGLPQEVIAVLFAFTSRSPKSIRDNLAELIAAGDLDLADSTPRSHDDSALRAANEKARQFHSKWVIGYGHSSVAEHATLPYGIENVSLHAAKFLESNRLAAYTEQSTRYQIIGPERFVRPAELEQAQGYRSAYEAHCRRMFDLYGQALTLLRPYFEKKFPKKAGASDRAWHASITAQSCDVARYLLPAATWTRLGMTLNARSAAHTIAKCRAHPLAEIRAIGEQLLAQGERIAPTLLKYASPPATWNRRREAKARLVSIKVSDEHHGVGATIRWDGDRAVGQQPHVTLLRSSQDPTDALVAAILFEARGVSMEQALRVAEGMSGEEKLRIVGDAVGAPEDHTALPACFEQVTIQLELLVDFGSYRDLQRHRMVSAIEQPTTTKNGYSVPPELDEVGLGSAIDAAIHQAQECEELLLSNDVTAPVAPLVAVQGHHKRLLWTLNLRELDHVVRLRSAPQGHIAYRRVARAMQSAFAAAHPDLAAFIRFHAEKTTEELTRLAAEEKAEAKRRAAGN